MDNKKLQINIPPVVSVLGHVDHGKTTLLDAIRKSNIAQREHGGITQKIGASRIETLHDGKKQQITFIDTPGHQAFTNMRSRGAQAADIALLIVSAADGVMPQTRESIEILKKTQVPFIVVLTKSDLPDKNIEKVKQQLVRENILLEGYGGDVPVIEVSARTGQNIKELLDLILLVFEMSGKSAQPDEPLSAIVIESKLDPRSGPRATIVVKKGKIAVKDEITTDSTSGKVRSLITDSGEFVKEARVGDAVEVLGFEDVPPVGSIIINSKFNPTAGGQNAKLNENEGKIVSRNQESKTLSLILAADTLGSLEAIVSCLPKEVDIIEQKTGDISEADILFAKSTGAIVLTFNLKLKNDIIHFAKIEKVLLKNYNIIYEMLDEIQQVIEGKKLMEVEQIYGVGKLAATFPYEKTTVLGVVIQDGRIAKGDKARIVRGESVIGETQVVSLRQGKNPITKVEKGQECGLLISPMLDITIGDMIICHS